MSDLPSDLTPRILRGHVLDVLRTLPSESVQCVVTSPPYWGQRSYGTEPQIWGGNAAHPHLWSSTPPRRSRSADDQGQNAAYKRERLEYNNHASAQVGSPENYEAQGGEICDCGAWRGELGLEPTPEMFVAHLTSVFGEVFRVLKKDGTCWVNIASTYATYPSGTTGEKRWAKSTYFLGGTATVGPEQAGTIDKRAPGWKRKELVPVPWLFGLAMHEAGWWLRSDVQWWKLNGKHENVEDRPFRAHEYITMYTKTADPYYNEEALRQPYVPSTIREIGVAYRSESKTVQFEGKEYSLYDRAGAQDPSELKRRIIRRLAERGGSMLPDVWFMSTGNGEGRHVAVFPETLPELCITASTRPGGLVLDPFAGSGTTLRVARRLRRASLGIELSPQYADYAQEKTARPQSTTLQSFEEEVPSE
ncbi:MAG: site-specific DNA-methyltransferase [Euryarchaeota archaeon]|nr:site-specific DNA-methyltransferase [Euryarchaeota archaeon]MDE1881594.1 site-specific DNA-methyltransferase [Euryarchaeota archaeon]